MDATERRIPAQRPMGFFGEGNCSGDAKGGLARIEAGSGEDITVQQLKSSRTVSTKKARRDRFLESRTCCKSNS